MLPPVYQTVCRHLLVDCRHNVQYHMNLKSVMENFVLHKMFQLQKEDASCTVCMSCDYQ